MGIPHSPLPGDVRMHACVAFLQKVIQVSPGPSSLTKDKVITVSSLQETSKEEIRS